MKHKKLEAILYSTAGVAATLVIVIVINFIVSSMRVRADLTAEKVHTLSEGTKAILKKIDGPVEIRFYVSQGENVDVMIKTFAQRVEDLLNEYRRLARGKIQIKKLDPEPDSDAEESAKLDGIEPQGSPFSGEQFYLGLAVSHLDQKFPVPALSLQRERLLEYDLSRAISRVASPTKPTLGVMSSLPVFGMPMNPMMMRMGQQGGSEPWIFLSELRQDFTVKQVQMDADKIDDDIQVLLVVHPRDIPEKGLYALDQFVMRGGKLIACLDAHSLVDNRTQQNPMMGQMGGGTSNLEKLLKTWGVQFDTTKVVADLTFARELGGRNGRPQLVPTFLFLSPLGINTEDALTSQLDSIWLPFSGTFSGTPVEGLKQTVLLHSTTKSQLVDGFMASLSGEQIAKEFKSSGKEYPLAIRLTGKFKTAFPEGKPDTKDAKEDDEEKKKEGEDKKADTAKKEEKKPDNSLKETSSDNAVILIGDVDFLADQFAVQVQNFLGAKIVSVMNGNLSLVQNMVEQFSGDNSLIGSRSRATQSRPFTRIKQMEANAQEALRNKVKQLEDALAETQRKLNELQTKKEAGQRFILSPEQQAEVVKFRKQEAEAKKELKEVRKQLRRDIDSLQNGLKWANIAGMPVLVILGGLGAAILKRQRKK